jgi:hypothetical protein
MIDKSERGFSFVDAALTHAQARGKEHWLNKIVQLVDWNPFRETWIDFTLRERADLAGTQSCYFAVCSWQNGMV